MKSLRSLASLALLALLALTSLAVAMFAGLALAQAPTPQQRGAGAGRGGPAGGAGNRGGRGAPTPIVLGEDDKPAYPAAPAGFDAKREGASRGTVELVEYDSKSVGTRRRINIYLPPGYSKDVRYPVFYLLHGAGDNETGWQQKGAADNILDNLYADKKAVPMIVVMPHGIPQAPGTEQPAAPQAARGGQDAEAPAGGRGGTRGTGGRGGAGRGNVDYNATNALFETDLLNDIIPFVEARFPVIADRQHRALAGLSLGGGQSFVIGTKHLNMFAHIGGFSSAIIGVQPASLATDGDALSKNLKTFWVSCGDRDTLFAASQTLHQALKEKKVPHIWHVDSGAHEWPVWKNDLYLLTPLLFR